MEKEIYSSLPFYQKIFVSNRLIMGAILLNIIILIALSFDELSAYVEDLEYLDSLLTIYFFCEMLVKVRVLGWQTYIKSGWNKMDFFIVLVTLPSLAFLFFDLPDFSFLLILRALRVAKFFRFLKFVPNLDHILDGVGRALRASVFILVAFFMYNIIISLFTCYLFKDIAPQYFGNALISLYSIFKMFTLEGWYEVPETIAANYHGNALHLEFFVKFYFIFIVITGGVFGLSIVNAIFVDEMISDNNEELEQKIDTLEAKIDSLIDTITILREENHLNS